MALKFPGSESKSEKTKKIKGLKKDQLVILLLFGILLVVIAIPTSPGRSAPKTPQRKTEHRQKQPRQEKMEQQARPMNSGRNSGLRRRFSWWRAWERWK